MHEGKKPFECELCDSKFMTRPKPNMHIDALHEGKKRFDCKDCGVKFTQKKSIKIHVPHCKGKQDHMCPYVSIAGCIGARIHLCIYIYMFTYLGLYFLKRT